MDNQREISNPPRNATWIDYHKEMTIKYRYFVVTDDLLPFYTNESIDDIKQLGSAVIDVYNNEWTSDDWDRSVYKYRFANGSIYEWFAQPSTLLPNHSTFDPISLRKDGKIIELNYRSTSTGSYESLNYMVEDGHIIAVMGGGNLTRTINGEWSRQVGINSYVVDFSAQDFKAMFNRMNAKKWRGFFADIIEDMIRNEGLSRSYVTPYYGAAEPVTN